MPTRSTVSYEEVESLLQKATDFLDGAARQIKELGLHPAENIRRIGEAIVLASEIRADIYALRPDLAPGYIQKG